MLWNIRRDILIITSIIQLFFCSAPCFCFRSIPLWHCIPNCFQVPIVKPLEVSSSLPFPHIPMSRGENHARQQVQLQPRERYISGNNYQKHYSSSNDFHHFTDVNLPQQQRYEQDESWQPNQHSDEPIIYIAETTPSPYDELLDATKLILRQSQPVSVFYQYDEDYLLESLNDRSNRTIATYPSAINKTLKNVSVAKRKSLLPQILSGDNSYRAHSLRTERLADPHLTMYPKGKLQRTSFNVLNVKRQKTYSNNNALRRNYQAKRAAFPSAVCNSRRLRKVMLQAITADVSESKRSVAEAAEHAYQGIKFDVICAEGDFSYTIHAKKYCEVTKENMTCFAFR